MKNCIVRTWVEEVGEVFYTGVGWLSDRNEAKLYSLPEVEQVVQNMRDQDEYGYWERFDKSRSSL